MTEKSKARPIIKCLIWDLDNTVWQGILAEGGGERLRGGVRETIETLDRRGILHSIASRNEQRPALRKLADFGLSEYFISPQIGWGMKSQSIKDIAEQLKLNCNSFAFIDDEPFEREEVAHALPQVRCYSAEDVSELPGLIDFSPAIITSDASKRRHMYLAEFERNRAEVEFEGTPSVFLRTLGIETSVRLTDPDQLDRVEELTNRTSQLNATGYTYTRKELASLCDDPDHLFLTMGMKDRFGIYGQIGIALIRFEGDAMRLRLFLFSCRVLSRGIAGAFLKWLGILSRHHGFKLQVEFLPNDYNRPMLLALRFAGFEPLQNMAGDMQWFELPSKLQINPADHIAFDVATEVYDELAAQAIKAGNMS